MNEVGHRFQDFAGCFHRLLWIVWLGVEVLARGAEIPGLRPPGGLLAPSFWEQHGWLAGSGLALSIGIVVAILLWARRPKPTVVAPPEIAARQALEPLRRRAEDDALAAGVARIVRAYLRAAFSLPPEEWTTEEWTNALRCRPDLAGEISASAEALLRECDLRHFAPSPPAAPGDLVDRAWTLVARIERHRQAGRPPDTAAAFPTPVAATSA